MDNLIEQVKEMTPPAAAARAIQNFDRGEFVEGLFNTADLVPLGKVAAAAKTALPHLATFLPAGLLGKDVGLFNRASRAGEDVDLGSDFYRETGMFRDPVKGEAVGELSDAGARLTDRLPRNDPSRYTTFGDMVEHPELYAINDPRIQALRDTPVRWFDQADLEANPQTMGGYDRAKKHLFLNPASEYEKDRLSLMAHEGMGHRVQHLFDFVGGTSPERLLPLIRGGPDYARLAKTNTPEQMETLLKYTASRRYQDKQGEYLAREIERRLRMPQHTLADEPIDALLGHPDNMINDRLWAKRVPEGILSPKGMGLFDF